MRILICIYWPKIILYYFKKSSSAHDQILRNLKKPLIENCFSIVKIFYMKSRDFFVANIYEKPYISVFLILMLN